MKNDNYKNECSPVSTHVSDETKTWLENVKNKYSIDISTQLFYVFSKMIKSEKQLEKIVVASLLDDHESRGNALREMARELGIETNVIDDVIIPLSLLSPAALPAIINPAEQLDTATAYFDPTYFAI